MLEHSFILTKSSGQKLKVDILVHEITNVVTVDKVTVVSEGARSDTREQQSKGYNWYWYSFIDDKLHKGKMDK